MKKNKKLCNECKVFLRKTYVGDYSDNWDYCVSCPECHIVYDLISKCQENLTKHAEKSKDFLHQKGNSSSKKDCLNTACPDLDFLNMVCTRNEVCKDKNRSPS